MKIPLSIARNYRPKWGVWEGIREVVQNFMDAFVKGDSILHDGTTLKVTNEGGTITPRDLAVLGATTKASDPGTRGQFGDGLKVGCLALVREGLDVRFRTGGLMYKAEILYNETYEAEVLTFSTRKLAKPVSGVRFEIGGITKSQWGHLRGRFLFDQEGPLLVASPGQIFVKDIWVCDREGFGFGYNLDQAEVGTDRDLVGDFNVRYAAGKILAKAMESGEVSAEKIMGMLSEGSEEVQFLKTFVSSAGRKQIKQAFHQRHGNSASPVTAGVDMRRAKRLNRQPVVANQALIDAVPELGVEQIVASDPVAERYDLAADLDSKERSIFFDAMHRIGLNQFDGLEVSVVKFTDPDQDGRRYGGKIEISRHVLADEWELLVVLIDQLAATRRIVHQIYKEMMRR